HWRGEVLVMGGSQRLRLLAVAAVALTVLLLAGCSLCHPRTAEGFVCELDEAAPPQVDRALGAWGGMCGGRTQVVFFDKDSRRVAESVGFPCRRRRL
ncbi:MAG: hypothetical protein ACYTG0_45030, partial [Planctomycetota bacterium]